MKKVLILVVMFFSAVSFSQAIGEGESQINGGIGFSSGWGVPLYVGFDYGVYPDITVGAQLTYATSSKTYLNTKINGSWFGIGVNGNYHFNTLLEMPSEWDLYAGLTLAYNSFSYDFNSPDGSVTGSYGESSGIGFAGQIGARYYFTDKLGINLEFGGGNITSGGKIGVTYKL